MKTITTFFMLMLFSISLQAQKTYALLAGVSNYGVDSINLSNTTNDVKQLKKVFDNQKFTSAIITSKYANHDNIVQKLKAIVNIAKPNDKIIFFFSGHGTPGGFVPSDRSFFNYQELVNILKKTKAKNVYCFIDACMSGSVKSISSNNFGVGNKTPNICFMTASDTTEISTESMFLGHGFFTKSLLKGVRGLSDKDANKSITLEELFNYVYQDVVHRTKRSNKEMHPQLICPVSMRQNVIAEW